MPLKVRRRARVVLAPELVEIVTPRTNAASITGGVLSTSGTGSSDWAREMFWHNTSSASRVRRPSHSASSRT